MQNKQIVEAYYPAKSIAVLWCYNVKWVIERINAGDFGPRCFFVNGDYRIPASGLNAFIERHKVRAPQELPEPVLARSEGELRRKLNGPNVCTE